MSAEPHFISHQSAQKRNETVSPIEELLFLSNQGLVFRSNKDFESGTRVAIGLHLSQLTGSVGKVVRSGKGAHFLNVEGLVADCRIVEVSLFQQFYQVTLLFDQLSEPERALLANSRLDFSASTSGCAEASFASPAPLPEIGLN